MVKILPIQMSPTALEDVPADSLASHMGRAIGEDNSFG